MPRQSGRGGSKGMFVGRTEPQESPVVPEAVLTRRIGRSGWVRRQAYPKLSASSATSSRGACRGVNDSAITLVVPLR